MHKGPVRVFQAGEINAGGVQTKLMQLFVR